MVILYKVIIELSIIISISLFVFTIYCTMIHNRSESTEIFYGANIFISYKTFKNRYLGWYLIKLNCIYFQSYLGNKAPADF